MGVIIPVGQGQATMRWALAGDTEVQVTTFGIGAPATISWEQSPQAIANASNAAGLTTAPGMASGWSFLGVWVDRMTVDGVIRYEFNTSVAGTGTSATLPSNCALLIRKLTALGGRKNRGRFFWPACVLLEANIDARGVIAAGQLAGLQAAFNTFRLELEEEGVQPILLHSDGSTATPITTFGVQPVIATQRRRMR